MKTDIKGFVLLSVCTTAVTVPELVATFTKFSLLCKHPRIKNMILVGSVKECLDEGSYFDATTN